MSHLRKITLLILLFSCGSAGAHGLRYTVTDEKSVVIELSYASGKAFSNEAYEIYRAGGGNPYQTGRTDPSGRIVFIPDSSGTWRIKAFSEDGHGLDITIETNLPAEQADTGEVLPDTLDGRLPSKKAPVGSGTRIFMALALIFGVFGAVSLFIRKRK
jgi:nickel transport protein